MLYFNNLKKNLKKGKRECQLFPAILVRYLTQIENTVSSAFRICDLPRLRGLGLILVHNRVSFRRTTHSKMMTGGDKKFVPLFKLDMIYKMNTIKQNLLSYW